MPAHIIVRNPEIGLLVPFARETAREIGQDLPFYAALTAYAVCVGAITLYFGQFGQQVALYLRSLLLFNAGLPFVLALYCLVTVIIPTVIKQPARPASASLQALQAATTPRFFAGLLLAESMPFFWASFTPAKLMLPRFYAYSHDVLLADIDWYLHLGIDPWRPLHAILGHPQTIRLLELIYHPLWLFLLMTFPVWVALSRKAAPIKRQFFLTYLLMWIVLGNLLAGIVLSGGPAFYAQLTGDHDRFAALISALSETGDLPFSAFSIQHRLWEIYQGHQIELGGGISAFPSLHVGVVTLYVFACWKTDRRLGLVALGYLVIMQAGSVALGWHYAIDGYFSITATWILWSLVRRFRSNYGG